MSRLKIIFVSLTATLLAASLVFANKPVSTPPEQTPTKVAPPTRTTPLLLAQTCVAEIGFNRKTDECQLMWEINGRNARRSSRTIDEQTMLFNAYWKNPDKNRPWIQYLNLEAEEPHLWPKNAATWAVHKKMWQSYLAAAAKFVEKFPTKRYRHICRRADDYGGRCDDGGLHACDTPKQKCAKPILCLSGRTHQAYWNLSCCRNRTGCIEEINSLSN